MTDSIPSTMRAMVLKGHGDLDMLEYHSDWPTPVPGPGEVLVRVHACGMNNTDINTRTAWYSKGVNTRTTGGALDAADADDAAWGGAPIAFPLIQGADVAGSVVAVGEGVDSAIIGKRVMIDTWVRDWNDPLNMNSCSYFGSERNGGYADFVAIDHRQVHAINTGISDEELATFATAYVTAENMLNRANVAQGDIVLIPGASGGVGSALIQLANRRGATTIGMSNESKHDDVRGFGVAGVLSRNPQNLKAELKAITGRETVDVVADVVGGDYWSTLIDVIARGGRYTCAGAIAGPMVEFDLRTFYLNDLVFAGATIVPPGVFANLVGYIERGEIRPVVAGVWPLRELREAQQAFISKQHIGNIVITMG